MRFFRRRDHSGDVNGLQSWLFLVLFLFVSFWKCLKTLRQPQRPLVLTYDVVKPYDSCVGISDIKIVVNVALPVRVDEDKTDKCFATFQQHR